MIKEAALKYRILYDSLSRFSVHLNKADSLSDIQNCLLCNLKYLYNYLLCRLIYFEDEKYVCYTISKEVQSVEADSAVILWQVESKVFDNGIPHYEKLNEDHPFYNTNSAEEIWVWKFNYKDASGMLVTLLSRHNNQFSKEHIPVLKMVSEMLYTKTRTIILLQNIQQKQEALSRSYHKLEESNKIISKLILQQEKIIDDRTKALTQSNNHLLELVQFNSHQIREPLTRIMGLISLQPMMSNEDFFGNYWQLLEQSVTDLDKTIKTVIVKTEKI